MVSKWKGWHLNPESLNPKVMHDSVLPFPWLHFSSSWNTISFLIKVVWIRFQVLVIFFKSRWIQSQSCKLNLNILIPTPSSSHCCSNGCDFPLNSFRQMSSDSIPLESAPATSPAYRWVLRCCDMGPPGKCTQCPCTYSLAVQRNHHPWGHPCNWDENHRINASSFHRLSGWFWYARDTSGDLAESSSSHPQWRQFKRTSVVWLSPLSSFIYFTLHSSTRSLSK